MTKLFRPSFLSLTPLFFFLNEDVQSVMISNDNKVYQGLRTNRYTETRSLQDGSEDVFCEKVFVVDVEPDPRSTEHQTSNEWRCLITERDNATGMKSKLVYRINQLPSKKGANQDINLHDGSDGMIIKMGSQYKDNDFNILLPPSADIITPTDQRENRYESQSRSPLSFDGAKSILVIRVMGNETGQEPTADTSTISRRVFGGSDDNLNLKDGYASCSGNQLSIEKATGYDQIVDGVIEVQLSVSTTNQTGPTLENAVVAATKAKLGTNQELESIYDFIMICLPPGTAVKTAYAYVRGKRSIYNDNWCLLPSVQMHEIGHNIGLRHSNENNKAYNDQSCLMGLSYTSNHEFPKMCFNGAKSWLLGWYKNKSTSIKLDSDDQDAYWNGNLVGVTNYLTVSATQTQHTKHQHVVVAEIVTSDDSDDESANYYLLFNHKDGINSQVAEFGDQITITRGHFHGTGDYLNEIDASEHMGHLAVGDSYTIRNYLQSEVDLIIKFCETDSDITSPTIADVHAAKVSVYLSTGTDHCPSPITTPAPTSLVTSSPTAAPNINTAPSPTNINKCSSGEFRFIFQIQIDSYSDETSWDIRSEDGAIVVQSMASLRESTTLQTHDLCLRDGCYDFKIKDDWGDGICCNYGHGWYKGYLYNDDSNTDPIFQGGKFSDVVVERFCGTSSVTSPSTPGGKDNDSPSVSPPSNDLIQCPSGELKMEVSLMTDKYPEETSFHIFDRSNTNIMDEQGPFFKNAKNEFNKCITPGCYTFEIEDKWGDGICCNYGQGDFEVMVDGKKVLQGENFKRSFSQSFCGCGVGKKHFDLSIIPDPFPEETSWELKNSANNVVLSGSSIGDSGCIPDGCYTLYIYDTYGDGMCCEYGNGSFTVTYDNNEVATGGQFRSVYSTSFGDSCDTAANIAEPSPVVINQGYEKGEVIKEDDEPRGAIGCLLKKAFRLFK